MVCQDSQWSREVVSQKSFVSLGFRGFDLVNVIY